MRRTLTLMAAVMVLAVGCSSGGGTEPTVAVQTASTQQAPSSPRCDVLFAAGATLPAAMPDMCAQTATDLLAIGSFPCKDGRRLYQVDVSSGEAWAFTAGLVTVRPEVAVDPAYKAAYDSCS